MIKLNNALITEEEFEQAAKDAGYSISRKETVFYEGIVGDDKIKLWVDRPGSFMYLSIGDKIMKSNSRPFIELSKKIHDAIMFVRQGKEY